MVRFFQFILLTLFVLALKGYSYDISEYPYKSKYDAMFKEMTDVNTITASLNDKETDVVFSALKRVGQLKIVAARKKVEEIVGESNPIANQGKPEQRSEYTHLFNMGVMVLGKIGDATDAIMLSKLLRETPDKISEICILQALGDLSMSKVALEYLHQYSELIDNRSDYRVVKTLVDSIAAHNSKDSINVLYSLKERAPQNLRSYINEIVKKLNATGQSTEDENSTNEIKDNKGKTNK